MGPTCYSQCDLVVFFLIRSCLYHYCVYSVIWHYSYICHFFHVISSFCFEVHFFSSFCVLRHDVQHNQTQFNLFTFTLLSLQCLFSNTTFSHLLLSYLFCNLVVHLSFVSLFFPSCVKVLYKTNQTLFFFLSFFFLQ